MSRFYRLWNLSILVGLLFSILAVSSASLASGEDASTSAAPMRVAVLIFPWVELLDFAAPAEIFAGVRDEEGEALFEVYTVAPNKNVLERLRFLSITP